MAGSCLSVNAWYWTLYHASTEIYTGSVLALLRSRLLADTWSRDWGCTIPVPRQPSACYQLSSTGILPYLQLARYCTVCKYWHESDFFSLFCTGITPKSGMGLYYASTAPTLGPEPTVQCRHCSLLKAGAVLYHL